MHNLLSLKIIPSKREAQVTAVAIKMIITTSKKTAHKCSQRRKNKLKPYRHMRHNKWLKVFECVRVCVFVHGKEIESERKKIMLEHYVQFKTIVVMVICFFLHLFGLLLLLFLFLLKFAIHCENIQRMSILAVLHVLLPLLLLLLYAFICCQCHDYRRILFEHIDWI